jgi:hypothetical protein
LYHGKIDNISLASTNREPQSKRRRKWYQIVGTNVSSFRRGWAVTPYICVCIMLHHQLFRRCGEHFCDLERYPFREENMGYIESRAVPFFSCAVLRALMQQLGIFRGHFQRLLMLRRSSVGPNPDMEAHRIPLTQNLTHSRGSVWCAGWDSEESRDRK